MSANNLHNSTRKALWLVIFLFAFATTFAQEIPNGDGDLLWERPLNGRTLNDAKFHPINGNIIAAVDNEILEIDPKDGHTIRRFEGGIGINEFGRIDISTDGSLIIISKGGAPDINLFDYNLGQIKKLLLLEPWSNVDFFPNSTKILYHQSKNLIIYDVIKDTLISKSDSLPYNQYFRYSKLSKDGKLIALGLSTNNFGNISYTMELWDAETLTKIQELGNYKVGDLGIYK